MRFQRIYEAVHFRPWFISAAGFASVASLLERAESGGIPEQVGESWLSDFIRERPPMEMDGNGIAKIHIFGVVGLHLTGIEKTCGNTDYSDIKREISEALGLGAQGILFIVDSPGGMVTGCHECAEAISACPVPTVVFTDTQICSAAYYLASGVNKIVSSPSADVGNIGVIIPWVDQSKLWELAGIKSDPIFNTGADLKSIGKGPSIVGAQRQFLQERVDDDAARFQKHVEDHRAVDDEVFRAGWYSGKRAVDLGLADFNGDESTAYGVLLSEIPVD